MLADFWKGVGGKLAERWLAALFSPAFVFWTGALFAWLYGPGRPTVERLGWIGALKHWSAQLQGLPAVVQGLLVVAPLVLITVSGLALQQLSRPVLRLLEGYWPAWLAGMRERLQRRLSDRADENAKKLRALSSRPIAALSAAEVAERSRRHEAFRRIPPIAAQRMPTRLGNLLRTSELRPGSRYGLDAVTCWPRLWLLIPDTSRQEVTAARAALHLLVQTWLCGLAFIVFGVWIWWAPAVGLAVAVGTYYIHMQSAARTYGQLVESCYDVHRALLYQALRWPQPTNPKDEYAAGRRITAYLTAGSRAAIPTFVTPPP
jgi:hypothetical protein